MFLYYPVFSRMDTRQAAASRVPMRVLIMSAILVCIANVAVAQTPPPAAMDQKAARPGKMPTGRQDPKGTAEAKGAPRDALASCLSQWEKSTHMSRQEWGRACRRVANRLQNLQVK